MSIEKLLLLLLNNSANMKNNIGHVFRKIKWKLVEIHCWKPSRNIDATN